MMKEKVTKRKNSAFLAQDHSGEILTLLRSHLTSAKLRKKLSDYHERDIAEVFPLLSPEERKRLYLILDASALADILEYCDDSGMFLRELSPSTQAMILSRMEIQDAQSYLQQRPRHEKNRLLGLMDEKTHRQIAMLDSFDTEEIGSRMSANYVRIPVDLTVREAMRQLIVQAEEHDNISTIYVLEENGVFSGAIDLKALIIARETTPLEEITMSSYPYVYANERIEDCIERLKDYSEDSIPVLDQEHRMRGVLTANDIAELVDQEISEDYAKIAGLSSEEDLYEPLGQSVKNACRG